VDFSSGISKILWAWIPSLEAKRSVLSYYKNKLFKNRRFGNVWAENSLPAKKRKHPYHKPRRLLKH